MLDLSPAYKEKSINSRSQLGGFLFLVYLPLLLAYLVYTIQPEFVPIPTCCACPIPGVTPDDSFVYAARNAACSANECVLPFFQSQIVTYQLKRDDLITDIHQRTLTHTLTTTRPHTPTTTHTRTTHHMVHAAHHMVHAAHHPNKHLLIHTQQQPQPPHLKSDRQ